MQVIHLTIVQKVFQKLLYEKKVFCFYVYVAKDVYIQEGRIK